MIQKKLRGAPMASAAPLMSFRSAAIDTEVYSVTSPGNQQSLDLIALLAVRSRVHPATVRAQLAAWGLAVSV